jgi:peptidoglycan/LPS O-acetylase OafA/YrhL
VGKDSHNLDLLRSLAVTLVLLDHTMKFLGAAGNWPFDINWVGRLGVAFFFVHTSFVLMLSLERTNLPGWRLPVNFYVRRLFRLYPLSGFVVLFTWLSGIPQATIHPNVIYGVTITPGVLLSNLTLTQNFVPQGVDILGQLWSLPIELDMYLLLPLLFFLARRWPRAFLWAAWPLAVMLALFATQAQVPGVWRLNWLSFAPCFVPGVMAYLLHSRVAARFASWWWPIFLLAVAFLFMLHPGWGPARFIALCIGLTFPLFKEQTNRFVNFVTYTVAKYSYGIYLGHLFVIWAAFYALRQFSPYLQGAVFVLLLFAIPWLFYVAIEQPGISIGKHIAQKITGNSVQPQLKPVVESRV